MNAITLFIINNLVTITAGMTLLNDKPLKGRELGRHLVHIAVWAVASTGLFYALLWLFHHFGWHDNYVSRITVASSLIVYALTFSRCSAAFKITAIVTLYAACFHLEFIRILILGDLYSDSIWLELFSIAVQCGITVLTALFIRKFRVTGMTGAPKMFSILMLVILAASEFCQTNIKAVLDLSGIEELRAIVLGKLFLGATFYVVILISYYMYYTITTAYVKQGELNALRQKQAESVTELERAYRLYDEIAVMRHEYKNRILSMDILLKSKQYDKLEKNFRSYLSADAEVLNVINCGNRVLNIILNVKRNDCKAKGIDFDVLAAVPAELPFESNDLSSLLVNLIDNAVEGTAGSEKPSVTVRMNVENNYLFVTVLNPVSGDVLGQNPKLFTTKKDKAIHGIGLRVVRSIVEKYNGHIRFGQQGGQFSADLMLEMPDTSTQNKS